MRAIKDAHLFEAGSVSPSDASLLDSVITRAATAERTHASGVADPAAAALNVPCFAASSLIKTARGEVPAGEIVPGDRVLTRDNGYEPVIWTHRSDHSAVDLSAERRLRPILLTRSALAPGVPERDTWIAPQQRVLFAHFLCELLFGVDEVLIAVQDLPATGPLERDLPKEGIGYVHLLMARHELVQSDGIWVETFQPTEADLAALPPGASLELMRACGLRDSRRILARYLAARTSLKPHQVRVLTAGPHDRARLDARSADQPAARAARHAAQASGVSRSVIAR